MVWTRLAFAAFGVITPVLSVVVSVFMLGLAAGSWLAGQYAKRIEEKTKLSSLQLYACSESIIGVGALVLPYLFVQARHLLLAAGNSDSFLYLLLSAVLAAILILPWCICMGTTYPLVMRAFREEGVADKTSFSYLYLANCLGAMLGTLVTAYVLIELFGFSGTLLVGAFGNFAVALLAMWRARASRLVASGQPAQIAGSEQPDKEAANSNRIALAILFWTGFASMAMEVVWVRAFLYAIGHEVYSFAQLLAAYLFGTCIGSAYYRHVGKKENKAPIGLVLAVLGAACVFPLIFNDIAVRQAVALTIADLTHGSGDALLTGVSSILAILSVVPASIFFGYLTPRIIDEYGQGNENTAGKLYAVNAVGCIIGPLFASYLLLPLIGVKYALILLSVPFLIPLFGQFKKLATPQKLLAGCSIVCCLLTVPTVAYEEVPRRWSNNYQILRDYAATVIAYGEGRQKNLLVNGCSVTSLDQCTKNIGHLPLLALQRKPESALVICFGMGTTFRALHSWGIDVTAVELVPSVVRSMSFFYPEANDLIASNRAHVVIDDGRRFLQRTEKTFDMVTIDPSPVMSKGCMSLLFSPEFFSLVKMRLKPGGVFELFMSYHDPVAFRAIARSLTDSFPYVRMFEAPGAGIYTFASEKPIVFPADAKAMLAAMPPKAVQDLTEWAGDNKDDYIKQHYKLFLDSELDVNRLLDPDKTLKLTDDRPINEYFFLRKAMGTTQAKFEMPYKTETGL